MLIHRKIYFLDDDKDLTDLFADFFDCADYEVSVFNSADQFLEAVQVQKPDIVFLDYNLPKTNGDLVAEKIAQDIRKILITGMFHLKPKQSFDQIITKPINFYELKKIIDLE